MKILCFGDLHLGHGPGYGRTPGDRLRDQQEVLGRIGGLAVEHGVDVVLNTGDTFEGPGITPEQLEVFANFVDACNTLGIPIVAISGNGKHDAAMRDTNAVDIFRHIEGITVSSTPQLVDVAGGTIATLPWVHPGRLIASNNGEVDRDEVNREAAGLLVATARGLRAQIPDGRPAILALHGSVSGSALPTGLPVDDLQEPVLDWDALDALGFDAIVAGHIHRAQRLGYGEPASTGFYTGSPMPLNFGEADGEHGVWILDLNEAGASGTTNRLTTAPVLGESSRRVEVEFVPIESRRFVTIDFDCTDETQARWLAAAAEHPSMIDPALVDDAVVRFRYHATAEQQRRIDVASIRAALLDAGAHVVMVEPEIVREDRSRVDGVSEDLAPLEAFDLWMQAQEIDPALALRARVRFAEHLEAVA